MNGFIRKGVAMVCLAACVPILGGCYCYREHVDPCWPERYNAATRHNLNDTFDAQALNGHIYDQTVWNYHFKSCWVEIPDPTPCNCIKPPDVPPCDKGLNKECDNDRKPSCIKILVPTSELNEAGRKHLQYLVRRLPGPDSKVYLQTARDLPYGTPIKEIPAKTTDLNAKRTEAIHEYLAVLTAGYTRYPASFDVAIHDRLPPDQPALPYSGAQRPVPVGTVVDWFNQYQGSIPLSPIFSGTTSSSTP